MVSIAIKFSVHQNIHLLVKFWTASYRSVSSDFCFLVLYLATCPCPLVVATTQMLGRKRRKILAVHVLHKASLVLCVPVAS